MRTCREDGCITVLSSLNPSSRCFIHDGPSWGRAGSRRKLEELRGEHPEDLRSESDICKLFACENKRYSLGVCRRHYDQTYAIRVKANR